MTNNSEIEEYVVNYKIFIDTCSILASSSEIFWKNITTLLEKHNKSIIVPLKSIEELQKHAGNALKPNLSRRSKDSLAKIAQLQHKNLIEIRGEKEDNFADNVFQVVFTKFRLKHRLLLITQDRNLAADIASINNFKSVKGNKVIVKRLDNKGFLKDF